MSNANAMDTRRVVIKELASAWFVPSSTLLYCTAMYCTALVFMVNGLHDQVCIVLQNVSEGEKGFKNKMYFSE